MFKIIAIFSFALSLNAYGKESCFKVSGMSCSSCEEKVTTALKTKLKGVESVNISAEKGEAKVEYEDGSTSDIEIISTINNEGYDASANTCS